VIFVPAPLTGAFVLEPEPHRDERGLFARTWCRRELEAHGLDSRIAQCSTSLNTKAGTLRGMHYQIAPFGETKIVRCTRGSMFDVIIDLREDSTTYMQHFAVVLSAANRTMMYVPAGFAHGFQTLEDDTEVFYQISEFYSPEHGRGVRWNDPVFGIEWPEPNDPILAQRDRSYPDFRPRLLSTS
jgi:dTDP-4-dehydrorhamnose 3,5-epimerase